MTNTSSPADRVGDPAIQAVDPVERDVKRRLEEDEGFAADILRGVSNADRGSIDTAFLRFFPHLQNVRGRHWSNLPSGTNLAHYLLVGVTPVLDLEPLSPDQFEARHGLSISAAEGLVSDGRVLANLYVRDPKPWRGMNHLNGLIAKSVVNGVRVDHCLNALNPQFEKTSAERGLKALRAEQFASALARTPGQLPQIRKISRALSDDGIPPLEGHQWAYLDVLKPDAAGTVGALVTEGQLVTAMEFMRIVKRAYVSPYTAALSGTCVWGPTDHDRWARLRETGLLPGELEGQKQWTDLEVILKRAPACTQLIIEELTRTPGVGLVTRPSSDKIVELQLREDWQTVKLAIFDLLLDLTRLARTDGYDPGKVEELRRWLQEQRKMLEAFQLGGAVGGGGAGWAVAGVVSVGVGIVFGPTWGAATGGLLGVPLGDVGGKIGFGLGGWAHEMSRPEHHRVVAALDAVTQSVGGQAGKGQRT